MAMKKRSLTELISWIGEDNIADQFTDQELTTIGTQVKEDFDVAWDSMSEWISLTEQGEELSEPATEGRSEPWDNASNFKSNDLQDAAYRFGERASMELLRPKDLVRCEVIGEDPTGEKGDRAERVSTYMSYQVNHTMADWRDAERKLLYTIPLMGTIFKKTFFDPMEGELVSDVIRYPHFAVNQSTRSMAELRDFTHILPLTQNEVISYQRAGIWLDIDLSLDGDVEEAGEKGHHDPLNTFLEQQCFCDLDGDGYEEAYTITIHKATCKVVRIVPRFAEEDIVVSDGERNYKATDIYGPLFDEYGPIDDDEGRQKVGFGIPDANGMLQETSRTFEIVKIQPERNLTMRSFLPSLDGSFLGVGYYQLLSAMVEAVNTGTNQLFDAGTLQNLPGGWLAKGMRKALGDMRFKPGEFKATNVMPQDLQSGIYPLPVGEPSAVLLQLVERMESKIRDTAASADLGEVVGTNTAASTVLLMMEEVQTSSTSLIAEQARGQGKEFKIIYALDALYADPRQYQTVLDDTQANYEADFTDTNLDISPTANPEMANRTARIQQAQLLIDSIDLIERSGGDVYATTRRYLEEIGIHSVDQILPPPTEEFEQSRIAAQEAQQQAAEAEQAFYQAQTDALNANTERMRADAQVKLTKLPEEVDKLRADVIKTLEQAETEETKNQISKYTADFNRLEQTINSIGKLDELEANRIAGIPTPGGPGQPNLTAIPGGQPRNL